jgi:hypothetical protein
MPDDQVQSQGRCFVVMPFGERWDEYYTGIYAPAIGDAGLLPIRADEVFRAGSILQDIVGLLLQSAVVLVDITEPNRNVHYELGLAHALGKPTVLVAPQDMGTFFDVGQERVIQYAKENAFWGQDLRRDVARAVRATAADPATAVPTAFLQIKPNRIAADESSVRLRRVEEMLAEIMRQLAASGLKEPSRLSGLVRGLPQAEQEAERLLAYKSRADVVRDLVGAGFGQIMAETAVATVAARKGT